MVHSLAGQGALSPRGCPMAGRATLEMLVPCILVHPFEAGLCQHQRRPQDELRQVT